MLQGQNFIPGVVLFVKIWQVHCINNATKLPMLPSVYSISIQTLLLMADTKDPLALFQVNLFIMLFLREDGLVITCHVIC